MAEPVREVAISIRSVSVMAGIVLPFPCPFGWTLRKLIALAPVPVVSLLAPVVNLVVPVLIVTIVVVVVVVDLGRAVAPIVVTPVTSGRTVGRGEIIARIRVIIIRRA